MNRILFLGIVLGLSLNLHGQKYRTAVTPTVGLVLPILDGGLGLHLGVNPTFRLMPWLSAEGQFSIMAMSIKSEFLSGVPSRQQRLFSAAALAGLRLYLAGERQKLRPCFNAMLGVAYVNETGVRPGFEGGASLGFYLQGKQIMGGLALESPGVAVAKMGFTIPPRKKVRR